LEGNKEEVWKAKNRQLAKENAALKETNMKVVEKLQAAVEFIKELATEPDNHLDEEDDVQINSYNMF